MSEGVTQAILAGRVECGYLIPEEPACRCVRPVGHEIPHRCKHEEPK